MLAVRNVGRRVALGAERAGSEKQRPDREQQPEISYAATRHRGECTEGGRIIPQIGQTDRMTSVDASAVLATHVRDVPDFPEPGIVFKDITPLLGDGPAFRVAIDALAEPYRAEQIDLVVGIEARGFLFAAPLAYALGAGCVPFRKPGKLPWETVEHTYDLEYGTDTLAAHVDAIGEGTRVLIVDDVLATGGTASAAVELVGRLGGELVGCAVLMELAFLSGREKLGNHKVTSILVID